MAKKEETNSKTALIFGAIILILIVLIIIANAIENQKHTNTIEAVKTIANSMIEAANRLP